MIMQDYWYIREGFEQRIKEYLALAPVVEVDLEFEVMEKDFNSAGKGSSETKNLLKRLGVESDILRRVAVSAYEAEINMAAHSRGGKMISEVYDDHIHVRFEDIGPGIENIDQAMVPGYSTADELVRELGFGAGLGLPNIKKNCDAMHIRSAKDSPTLLEFIIYFG